MIIIEHKTHFVVKIDYDSFFKRNIKAVKDIPGYRWENEVKRWILPLSERHRVEMMKRECRAQFYYADTAKPEQTGEIPELPDLTFDHGLINVTTRPYQNKGIARMVQLQRCINGDDPGLGKAQPLSSKVLTPLGWKLMKDIGIGDYINGCDGLIYVVNGVFPQKELREVYKVTFNDGFSTECDKEHLWTVRDQNRRRRNKGWTVKSLSDIITQGIEHKPHINRLNTGRQPALKWEIPIAKPVLFRSKNYVIDPYIFGALLGDGYICGNVICISIPDHEIETCERIGKLLPKHLKLKVNRHPACPQYHITQNKTTTKNPFKSEIKRLNVNVKGGKKFIPESYKLGSIEQRIELLKGLMDTDGSCRKNRTTFHTKSELLAKDVAELVQSLGGIAIVRIYDRTKHSKGIEYQVNVRTNFCPFHLSSKAKNWKSNKRTFASRYIKSIEFVRNDYVQCISVTAPDCLYITDNFIVTHNTIQTIGALNITKQFPAVVICPATLKYNWVAEIEKYSNIRAMILDDKNKNTWLNFYHAGMKDVFIVNYESLAKFFVSKMPEGKRWKSDKIELLKAWDIIKTVVIDESHRLKDPTTNQSKICLRLTQGKEFVYMLTGTPYVNKVSDLFPQLAILGKLNMFGGKKGFLDRYCEGGTGANNLSELNFLLNKYCYFKRVKKDVLKELPDKQRNTLICEISTRKEYDFAVSEFESWLSSKGCSDKDIAKKLRGEILVKMNALRNISAKGKIDNAIEFIDEVVGSGEKIVVFANLKDVIKPLKAKYTQAVEIHGEISQDERNNAVQKFQNDPNCKIIICNIKAAGVGLTLTASSTVLFVEYPWTWADCLQCEDRTHRLGQKEAVSVNYLFGKNTIDERLFNIIKDKKEAGNVVSGATESVEETQIDKILNLFS